MRLSYVIISCNRRQTLLQTLARLPKVTPLPPSLWEIWVVDNASTDGSADAVAEQFPRVNLIRNPENQGMFARNHAFGKCAGQYIISIDEDCHPLDHRSVSTALSRMDRDESIAALVGRVLHSSGATEAPEMAAICMGGATCFRKSAIEQVGGFAHEGFRQVEEYDLSFRLWGAGHRVERCEQFVFNHEKIESESEGGDDAMAHQLDLRNHLIIAQRHLPQKLAKIYWSDWKLRYTALADYNNHSKEAMKGLWSARLWNWRNMKKGRNPINDDAIENIFGFRRQSTAVGNWARQNQVWRVVIADFGKNIYATYNACHANGLQIRCIVDNNPAFIGLHYRDLPIVPMSRTFHGGGIEGVVVANINPAQIDARLASLRHHFHGPILRLWTPEKIAEVRQAAAA